MQPSTENTVREWKKRRFGWKRVVDVLVVRKQAPAARALSAPWLSAGSDSVGSFQSILADFLDDCSARDSKASRNLSLVAVERDQRHQQKFTFKHVAKHCG